MKSSHTNSKFTLLLALTSTLALGAIAVGANSGCVETRTTDSTGQYVDDSVITAKVKSALLGDNNVKSFAVSVETVKGVVQLSGFVNTQDQKDAAGKDARGVAGVKEVKNNLIVK
ncbi:osmotically-inducible protein Y precursor [mine drainage metagenome]|uniref:Osmotically-inducible protein Y n=1 Tax=mine drainage metagenome TaxID=410659 RepID=A0A1J5RQV6_9ZZZZ